MPNVFRDVDVTAALEAIMQANTKHYQNDFYDYDIKKLSEAANSKNPEDKRLLWMSRYSGTWFLSERDVFMRDTAENQIWLHYGDSPQNRLLAYAVEITGEQDSIIRGNIHELNYMSHAARVEKTALSTATVLVTMGDGTEKKLSYERYNKYKERDLEPDKHDGIIFCRYDPKQSAELDNLLREERASRDRYSRPGNIAEHVKKLTAPKKHTIQEQMANGAELASRENAARKPPEKGRGKRGER